MVHVVDVMGVFGYTRWHQAGQMMNIVQLRVLRELASDNVTGVEALIDDQVRVNARSARTKNAHVILKFFVFLDLHASCENVIALTWCEQALPTILCLHISTKQRL